MSLTKSKRTEDTLIVSDQVKIMPTIHHVNICLTYCPLSTHLFSGSSHLLGPGNQTRDVVTWMVPQHQPALSALPISQLQGQLFCLFYIADLGAGRRGRASPLIWPKFQFLNAKLAPPAPGFVNSWIRPLNLVWAVFSLSVDSLLFV